MSNQLTHIADVKVGRVKGNSRVYPQLRLPSQYADLAGKKASLYEINDIGEEVAFIIRFGAKNSLAAYHKRAERAEGHVSAREPCRGSSQIRFLRVLIEEFESGKLDSAKTMRLIKDIVEAPVYPAGE